LIDPPTQLPSISSILASGVEGLSALDEIISSRIQQSSGYYDSSNDLFVQMAARRNREMSDMLNLGDNGNGNGTPRERRGSVGERVSRGLSTNLDSNPNPIATSNFSPSGTEDEELARAIAASLPSTSSQPNFTATASLHGEDDELARAIAASSMLPQNASLPTSVPAPAIAHAPAPAPAPASTPLRFSLPDPDNDVELQRALLRALNEQNYETTTANAGNDSVLLSDALSAVSAVPAQYDATVTTEDMVSAAVAASMTEQQVHEEVRMAYFKRQEQTHLPFTNAILSFRRPNSRQQ
jgi:hypothetical protein